MEVSSIEVKDFKRLKEIEIAITQITYIVGGNNSGKSSFLQAIHAAAMAAQVSSETKQTVVAEELLKYSPTGTFEYLGHGAVYENQKGGKRAIIIFKGIADNDLEAQYRVEMYRGRNYSNVGIDRTGHYQGFGSYLIDADRLFSVYVPGLAGLPHREEYRSEAYVFRRAAGGDANLVLRNILLQLKDQEKLIDLCELLSELFGPVDIQVKFNPKLDLNIDVRVSLGGGVAVPIDLCGTGFLQAIQICAYVLRFNPHLLLLDEPDSHLHPSNQVLLAGVLERISTVHNAKIVLATHSRHLINAAPESASFVVIKDGRVVDDTESDVVKMLMDIGALDKLDKEQKNVLFFTEDAKSNMLKLLVSQHISQDEFDIISYNGSSNDATAHIISELKKNIYRDKIVVIHRDRDFMTDKEAQSWVEKMRQYGLVPFVTKWSDIEAYFCTAPHLASLYQIDVTFVENWLVDLMVRYDEKIRGAFRRKRQDINKKQYADGGSPVTAELMPDDSPVTIDHAKGKDLLSYVNTHLSEITKSTVKPTNISQVVLAPDIGELLENFKIKCE